MPPEEVIDNTDFNIDKELKRLYDLVSLSSESDDQSEQRRQQINQQMTTVFKFYNESSDSVPTLSDGDKKLYMETFYSHQEVPFQLKAKRLSHALSSTSEVFDRGMTWTYLGCNAASLALFGIGFFTANPVLIGAAATFMAYEWNLIDGFGALGVSADALYHGDKFVAGMNFLSGGGLLAATAAATACFVIGVSSPILAPTLMSVSFAACMAIAASIEVHHIIRCDQKIKALENQISNTDEVPTKIALSKALLLEKAKREDHKVGLGVWTACTVAMTAVATVAIVTASVFTCGAAAALLIPIAVGLGAALTGALRVQKFNLRTSHVEYLQESVKSGAIDDLLELKYNSNIKWEGKDKDIKRLEKIVRENPEQAKKIIDMLSKEDNFRQKIEKFFLPQDSTLPPDILTRKVHISSMGFLKGVEMTLGEYIGDMFFKDITKAEALLQALASGDKKNLIDAARQSRSFSLGKSTGEKICDEIFDVSDSELDGLKQSIPPT